MSVCLHHPLKRVNRAHLPSLLLELFVGIRLTIFVLFRRGHGLTDNLQFVLLDPLDVLSDQVSVSTTMSDGGPGEPGKAPAARHTSSMLSLTQYLVIVTSLVWPIRWTRSTAWASIIGFQCGSTRCTWEAAVRSTLLQLYNSALFFLTKNHH